jgi:hypothetical protein
MQIWTYKNVIKCSLCQFPKLAVLTGAQELLNHPVAGLCCRGLGAARISMLLIFG